MISCRQTFQTEPFLPRPLPSSRASVCLQAVPSCSWPDRQLRSIFLPDTASFCLVIYFCLRAPCSRHRPDRPRHEQADSLPSLSCRLIAHSFFAWLPLTDAPQCMPHAAMADVYACGACNHHRHCPPPDVHQRHLFASSRIIRRDVLDIDIFYYY